MEQYAPPSMPRFLDSAGRFAISTNMKVMYSTLMAHEHLVEVDEWRFFRPTRGGRRPHLFLTRDPHARAVSAFKDKFRRQMDLVGTPEFWGWQRIHRVQFRHLGLREGDSDERKREAFLQMSFSHFVDLLPRTLIWDGHLRPQYLLGSIRLKRLLPVASARVTHHRRMEALDPDEMKQEWDLDVGQRRNATPKGRDPEYFDAGVTERVQQVYRTDCMRFGYAS